MRVVELFAGVGGFRIGLERASKDFQTVWSNQYEPSTKTQHASLIYQSCFGTEGHSNIDINLVKTDEIPDHDLLVCGFPCQDYSVATTSNYSGGIEGKKGVLWWQIYRILLEKGDNRPNYLFFENVDRLLKSPSKQRGRDFAIILTSLSDLGYIVEWRVINASEYGFPQRRKRTYIMAYKKDSVVSKQIINPKQWLLQDGVMSSTFPFETNGDVIEFDIEGTIQIISDSFNKDQKESPFKDSGIIINRKVLTTKTISQYNGSVQTLGNVVVNEELVPDDFFIDDKDLQRWVYTKGPKKINRVSKDGYEYVYSEGGMTFPDSLDKPSRTIITDEGGKSPSRFKHVILTPSGRYRRLLPIELERLNMFPDNHTQHPLVSDTKRAFLMGNALVCGVVTELGKSLYKYIHK
jgi:DNA (cytosine-5)-methyltransferase 1